MPLAAVTLVLPICRARFGVGEIKMVAAACGSRCFEGINSVVLQPEKVAGISEHVVANFCDLLVLHELGVFNFKLSAIHIHYRRPQVSFQALPFFGPVITHMFGVCFPFNSGVELTPAHEISATCCWECSNDAIATILGVTIEAEGESLEDT